MDASPNPRPRQQRRSDPGPGNKRAERPSSAPPEAVSTAPPPQPSASSVPPQQAPPPTSSFTADQFVQMFQAFCLAHEQAMQQQLFHQQQFAQFLQQQQAYNNTMIGLQAKASKLRQRKGPPPTFSGESNANPKTFVFDTEQYYSECQDEMLAESSDFVNIAASNLGPKVRSWYREWKLSLGEKPATWSKFKEDLCTHYVEADEQFKLLSKMHKLRWTGCMKTYTTDFLQLLSQFEGEMPEVIKRWFYQQGIRAATSRFVTQNLPTTLQETMELAQRFEDSQPPGSDTHQPKRKDEKSVADKKGNRPVPAKPRDASTPQATKPTVTCFKCGGSGHTAPNCPLNKGKSASPKNE